MIEESRQTPHLAYQTGSSVELPAESILILQEERAVLRAVIQVQRDQTLKKLLGCLDLTSLEVTDTEESVAQLAHAASTACELYNLPPVAALCLPSHLLSAARTALTEKEIKLATVVGGFPTGSTSPELVKAEIAEALQNGAQEIDLMFPLPLFFAGKDQCLLEVLRAAREATGEKPLKVILETGALKTQQNIVLVSQMALQSGVDFLKTSSGKIPEGASLRAVALLCHCIAEYEQQTGRKVGIKVSGGVRFPEQAARFYELVREILGEDWMNRNLFRIGASSLADSLAKRLNLKLLQAQKNVFRPFSAVQNTSDSADY